MQFAQLEAFVETARRGSVSRAAESLFVTQPTITGRLQALEAELGEDLFSRVKYGVALTDAGKALLPYARRALRAVSEGKVALQNLREATAGNLIIGAGPLISTYLLPIILVRFGAEHPKVRVAVRTGHSEEVLAMVLNEEVQVGMVRKLTHPEIASVRLYDDELVLVVHPNHSFASRQDVTAQDVAREGVVLFDRTTSYYEQVNDFFAAAGVAPRATLELDNVESAKKMVEKGLGIALLPHVVVGREVRLGTIKTVPIADNPHVKRENIAIYRRASGLGGIAHAFLSIIEELPRLLSEE
ncbi:MAG: LysR family transcriptional regulator [Dehalococcoidia bacterium]|nr:LysR family transcriptional regulator [Dehalococcoidia bacterium]